MRVFDEIVKDKKVLLIPMVSMRSYETNIYDMSCDGNVQSTICNILSIPQDVDYEITVVWPGKNFVTEKSLTLIEEFKSYVDPNKVHILLTDNYPVGGASVQRDIVGSQDMIEEVIEWSNKTEGDKMIIYTCDYLGITIESLKKKYDYKTCFWCYASRTLYFRPDYLEKYEHVEVDLSKSCDKLMLASIGQFQYFTGTCKIDKDKIVINTNFAAPWHPMYQYTPDKNILDKTDDLISKGYKIIYVPTRLTDKGYKIDDVLDVIETLVDEGMKIALLYSDPNESNYIENHYDDLSKHDIVYVKSEYYREKISRDRNTYYTMLDQVDCIVPYLEDCSEKYHTSMMEFMYFGTKIIYERMWDNEIADDGLEWNILNENLNNPGRHDGNRKLTEIFKYALDMPKKNLITVEGFDCIGKNTLINNIEKKGDIWNYVYHDDKDMKDNPRPDYRNTEVFKEWLKRYQKDQDRDLIKVYNYYTSSVTPNIFLTRKYISDYVYSRLFGREEITIKNIRNIKRYYNIVPILILWDSYDEYLKRCERIGCEIEYTKEEYDKINKMFADGYQEMFDNPLIGTTQGLIFDVNDSVGEDYVYKKCEEFIKKLNP